ncbi:MAG: aminoacyl-tRNA hydrolase [Bacteroidales bacterium]|nr:aminoacyl-tRNA hydrolase [Bacteroidales bacterium]MBN2750902.1 aminoacyl-tRNA hydrolase [Bacteroidales bacterium]
MPAFLNVATVHIADGLSSRSISSEFMFSASRSSGAGGQNVNKVNTKAELRFSIDSSAILTPQEKQTLLLALASKLNAEGEIVVVSQETRSQLKNKEIAEEKLILLLAKALTPKKKRVATKPSKASKRKRLDSKKQHSTKKEQRKKPLL